MLGQSTRFATSHGQRLAYTDHGAPAAPAVVICHGWSSKKEDSLQFLGGGALLDAGYRVLVLDYLGHGESDAPADDALYTNAMAADHVVAVMDAARVEHAHLVGYSMGGHHVGHAATHHPERVLSVVIGGERP